MTGVTIGKAGRRVLAEMDGGARLVPAKSAFRCAGRAVAADTVERMKRHELIEPAPGGWRISGPGRVWLQRREAPDMPNRMPANAADGKDTVEAARRGARVVNRAEEPLAWLHARDKISERQFEAGQRLRGDFMAAGEAPRVTMRWDAGPVERGKRSAPESLLPGERVTAAKRRLEAALDAAGPGLADVLRRTVCLGEGMETAERALGWPARSGRVVLTLGLDRVADFYRLAG